MGEIMKAIRNLKIWHKLLLIYVLLSLPIASLLYFLVSEKNIAIDFAQKEIHGDAYLRPLMGLLEHSLQYSAASVLSAEGNALKEALSGIEKDFKRLDDVQRKSGSFLDTAAKLKALKEKWGGLKKLTPGTKDQIAGSRAFIADIRALITHAGNTSNLILDPDLDTYYTMDATLVKLPELADLIARVLCVESIRAGQHDERTELIVLRGLLKSVLDGINEDMATGFNNNPSGNLRPGLEKKLAGSMAVFNAFSDSIDKNVGATNMRNRSAGLAQSGYKALAEAFKLYDPMVAELDNLLQRRIDGFNTRKYSVLAFVLIMITLATILIVAVINNITRPIGTISLTMQNFDNDLTVRIPVESNDEIGGLAHWFNSHVETLHDIITKVSDATRKVNASAGEISTAIAEQAAVTTQQSASVTEITSTMEELSASSLQITEHSGTVVDIAAGTWENTKIGAHAVDTFKSKMEEISNDNMKSTSEIISLGGKSKEISKVMEIIKGVTDQTKLIAFNAALEASSAGEAGKRFSVVAVEIRRLADSVMESTGEIETRIVEIQEAINRLVIASEKNSKGISEGMAYTAQIADLLGEIVNDARKTTDAAKQISLSTQQQKTAGDQALVALKEIVSGTGQASDSISHINVVSKDLAELSEDVLRLMEQFRLRKLTDSSSKKVMDI